MVNIGTLLAFVIVCIAVMVLRHTNPRPAAAVPHAVGAVGADPRRHRFNGYMMYKLGWVNWARLIIWLVIGLGRVFHLQPEAQQGAGPMHKSAGVPNRTPTMVD